MANLQRLKNKMLARLFTAMPSLSARWGEKLAHHGGEIPWAEAQKPLAQATVAVITTGGVHLKSQQPFDMADKDGDPTFRTFPADTAPGELTITHDYYNHADAEKDLNLVLPAGRLGELEAKGVIGKLFPTAVSLMGHIDGVHLERLKEHTGPEVAELLAGGEVDYALLVPA